VDNGWRGRRRAVEIGRWAVDRARGERASCGCVWKTALP
jgi:hypothetical protein